MERHEKSAANIVRLCGWSESSCGYCQGRRSRLVNKGKDDSSKSYGLLVDQISPQDYETLMNHGWRRSGLHLYKPDNWNSCCPALSIRLEVQRFEISKSQKRVLRSMDRCLHNYHSHVPEHRNHHKGREGRKLSRTERIIQDSGVLSHLQQLTNESLRSLLSRQRQQEANNVEVSQCSYKFQKMSKKTQPHTAVVFTTCCAAVAGRSKGRIQRDVLSLELATSLTELSSKQKWPFAVQLMAVERHEKSGHVLITLKVPEEDTSAKRKIETSQEATADAMEGVATQPPDVLGDWLGSMGHAPLPPPYRLTVTSLPARESALQPEVHRLYALYQHQVHGDPDPFSNAAQDIRDEDDDDGWDATGMEKARQMLEREYGATHSSGQIRRIQKSYVSFYRFLVESPLLVSPFKNNGQGPPLGTFHHQYRVEGRLIAVGVVDVLPRGLSSVYAFYHPTLSKNLALGKFAILKEIEWTQQSRLPYYYLGYYIESCPKMKYKADYRPSALLCPTHHVWVDAKKAQEILQRDSPERHCCTLHPGDPSKLNELGARVETIRLDVGASSIVTLEMLNSHGQAVVRPLLEEFLAEMGPDVSRRCIIKLV